MKLLRQGYDGLAEYANSLFWRSLMPTRHVVLTDHQAALVEQLVESGLYQNASEVLREGLRLVEKREVEEQFVLRRSVQRWLWGLRIFTQVVSRHLILPKH
jgi:putative addiction module CopG family antidote